MDIIREFLFDVINKDDGKFLIIYLYKNKMISNLSEFKIKKKRNRFIISIHILFSTKKILFCNLINRKYVYARSN